MNVYGIFQQHDLKWQNVVFKQEWKLRETLDIFLEMYSAYIHSDTRLTRVPAFTWHLSSQFVIDGNEKGFTLPKCSDQCTDPLIKLTFQNIGSETKFT